MKNYKIVITLEFEHHEEYVIWEPELYGQLVYSGKNVEQILFDQKTMGYNAKPIYATIELYDNPVVQEIDVTIGNNQVRRQIIIGTKILPIIRY